MAKKKRKTMTWTEFQRLCVVNSPKVPVAEINGCRYRWVGIGLVNEGKPDGTETMIGDKGGSGA